MRLALPDLYNEGETHAIESSISHHAIGVGRRHAVMAEDAALTVFVGQSTRQTWEDFFISPGSLDFASSGRLAGALAKPLARWHRFPWNQTLATTAAFGVGPSWSSRTSPLEVETRGGLILTQRGSLFMIRLKQ